MLLSDLFLHLDQHITFILTAITATAMNANPLSCLSSHVFHVNLMSQMGYPKLDNQSICQHGDPKMEFSTLVNSTTINAVNKIG